jgi:hypothetical protein
LTFACTVRIVGGTDRLARGCGVNVFGGVHMRMVSIREVFSVQTNLGDVIWVDIPEAERIEPTFS